MLESSKTGKNNESFTNHNICIYSTTIYSSSRTDGRCRWVLSLLKERSWTKGSKMAVKRNYKSTDFREQNVAYVCRIWWNESLHYYSWFHFPSDLFTILRFDVRFAFILVLFSLIGLYTTLENYKSDVEV